MIKKIASISFVITLLVALCVPALAMTDESTPAVSTSVKKTCPVDHCEYTATASVWVDPDVSFEGSYVGGSSQIYSSNYSSGQNIPAGYMGVYARVYVNDSLRSSSGWTYNTGKGNAMGTSTGVFDVFLNPAEGIVFSQGKFALYNGNGYNEYSTNRTPSLDVSRITPASARAAVSAPIEGTVETNSAGQTYGSGWLNPDLIEAIGVNGVHGYVLADELDAVGKKTSPDDEVSIPSTIPLYAEDGVTVIGAFKVGPSQSTEYSR